MHAATPASGGLPPISTPRWPAVYAMALCVAVLIASEFMPVSLLSPIAQDLHLSEGQAGQAIAVSGIFAVLTSLFMTSFIGRLDRRIVLLVLTAIMVFSGTMVALAPNYITLMAGRALIGIAIGGFWSMSAATVMRLVPAAQVPRGLAIIYGGNAIASAIAAPLGSFVGGLIGWRGAFFSVVPLAIAALIWQAATLPKLPVTERSSVAGMFALFRKRHFAVGMGAVFLAFMGQFTLFTYLRPFLEQVTHVSTPVLSALLLVVGAAGLIGTSVVGRFLDGRLNITLAVIPLGMAAVGMTMALLGASLWPVAVLLAVWGMLSTAGPVAWSTWLTLALPEDAEAGGGLMVAIIQLGITLGATAGGIVFDTHGARSTFWGSAVILVSASAVAYAASHVHKRLHAPQLRSA